MLALSQCESQGDPAKPLIASRKVLLPSPFLRAQSRDCAASQPDQNGGSELTGSAFRGSLGEVFELASLYASTGLTFQMQQEHRPNRLSNSPIDPLNLGVRHTLNR